MSNVMDYLKWRGDLSWSQDAPNSADALVFCILSYIRFAGSAVQDPDIPVCLDTVAEQMSELEDIEKRGRTKADIELFFAAAKTERFRNVRLYGYVDEFIPEQDTQFSAVTFLLDNGEYFIAFRGTDNTLVGWKEDFSMCFQQTIPAQRKAQQYVRRIQAEFSGKFYICGHSKGGNLAVFSAARSSPGVQQRIKTVYNLDGPGFSDYMMGDPGYSAIVPKIQTFVPQSSVIGMIMEREEEISIVKSNQVSVMQHDPYTWEISGKSFVPMTEITVDSKFVNMTISNWLEGMNHTEKIRMVEVLFGLLTTGDVTAASDILHPRNILNYLKTLNGDEDTRNAIKADLTALLLAAKKSRLQLSGKSDKGFTQEDITRLLPEGEANRDLSESAPDVETEVINTEGTAE